MNRLIVAVFVLASGAASAQVSGQMPDPATLPRSQAPAIHAAEVVKHKADMAEKEKHSRAHKCVDKLKAANLEPTPENVSVQCAPIFHPRNLQ
jgi:hypothetical protein